MFFPKMGALSDLNDFPGANAAGAGADFFDCFTDEGANGLQIGLKSALGFIVGMTDVVTDLTPFAAKITDSGHVVSPELIRKSHTC